MHTVTAYSKISHTNILQLTVSYMDLIEVGQW